MKTLEELFEGCTSEKMNKVLRDQPYTTESEYLQELAILVSVYLSLAIGIRTLAEEEGSVPTLPGFLLSMAQAIAQTQTLGCNTASVPAYLIAQAEDCEKHICSRLTASQKNGLSLRMDAIAKQCGISPFAQFCISCALVCEINVSIAQVFSGLGGGNGLSPYPAFGVLASVYELVHPNQAWGDTSVLQRDSVISRCFIEQISGERNSLATGAVRLHPAIKNYLLFGSFPRWGCCEILSQKSFSIDEHWICQKQMQEVASLVGQEVPFARIVFLIGAQGTGRRATLRFVADPLQRRVLMVNMAQATFLNANELANLRRALLIEKVVFQSLLVFEWQEEQAQEPGAFQERELLLESLLEELKELNPTVFVLASPETPLSYLRGIQTIPVHYTFPEATDQVLLWKHFTKSDAKEANINWGFLTRQFSSTPGCIRQVLEDARRVAQQRGGLLTQNILQEVITRRNTANFRGLVTKISSPFTWDDLVLSPLPRRQLEEARDCIRNRHQVYEEWGFKQKFPYGTAVTILLYGAPGTGKTMSAQVLANDLGMELYSVNVSQMVSKYIGDTAKNLDVIFEAVHGSGVILFFDEADALFTKRTDISNSNDRHANTETAHLLQLIERCNEVCILATNLMGNFDEAFRRRMMYLINLQLPDEQSRRCIWKNAFPASAPVENGIDFDLLASQLEVSGSIIKSAVLQASFYAAADGGVITMHHILKAVSHEYSKNGKVLPDYIKEYLATFATP